MREEQKIISDLLFVGMTRPPVILGVPYGAFVGEIMLGGLANIFTGNPLYMLIAVPIHGIFYLIGAHDPGIFAEIAVWIKTMARCRNSRFWGAVSFSPLPMKKWKSGR